MIIICGDCANEYGFAKVWDYPCDECAQQFVDNHRALGHAVHTREATKMDRVWSARL